MLKCFLMAHWWWAFVTNEKTNFDDKKPRYYVVLYVLLPLLLLLHSSWFSEFMFNKMFQEKFPYFCSVCSKWKTKKKLGIFEFSYSKNISNFEMFLSETFHSAQTLKLLDVFGFLASNMPVCGNLLCSPRKIYYHIL